jgi:hypothetical protein
MLMPLLTTAALVLSASETRPEALVAISKRSGVARGQASELAKTFAAALKEKGVPVSGEVEDLVSCAGKTPCLVEAARKKGVAVLVTLDLGKVLDDVVLHSEALSIDEDGRKINAYDDEGAPADIQKGLGKLEAAFVPAIRTALGLSAPPSTPEIVVAPTPEPVKPAVTPAAVTAPPASVAVTTSSSGGWSTSKIAGITLLGVGAAGLITGGVFGILTLGTVAKRNEKCPANATCTSKEAFDLDAAARRTQTVGLISAIAGGVIAAAGATLFFVDFGGGSSATITPETRGDGFTLTLSGRF